MKNVCLIPARGGSKRIPRKNIKEFHGKPLIAWSIECAISSNLFEDVYISTDDDEIAEIASKYGAKIPFKRPKDISNDISLDSDVRDHFISWLRKKDIKADFLCYLYPTAPFITHETLNGCFQSILNSNYDCVFTVTTFPYSPLRALKKNEDNNLTFMWEKFQNMRSQELPELFHDAGQCYFFNLNKKINNGYGIRFGYELPRYLCQDIDTYEDFQMAEKLFSIMRNL